MITRAEAIKLLEETGCSSNVIEHCEEVASLAFEIANKVKAKGHEINLELVYLGAFYTILEDVILMKSLML